MSEPSLALIKSLQVLQAARSPVIYPQSWVFESKSAAPDSDDDGVDTEGALFSWAGVRLQGKAQRRAWLRIDTLDLGQFYGPTFLPPQQSRESVLAQGVANLATTLAALGVALGSHADFNGTATVVPDHDDILEISDNTPWAYRLDGAEDGGEQQAAAPFQSLICEAQRCLWQPWGYFADLGTWAPLTGVQVADTPVSLMRIPTAGVSRVFVQVLGADGVVLPLAGPCLIEGAKEKEKEGKAKAQLLAAEESLFDFPATLTGSMPEVFTGTDASKVNQAASPLLSGHYPCAGLSSATVHIIPTDNVASYGIKMVSHDGYGWAEVPGALYENLTGPFAQTFNVTDLLGAQALIVNAVAVDTEIGHRFERRWMGAS